MGFQSSYALESAVIAKYILAERPNAKIGILYQDDDFGSDHLDPFVAALGDKAKTMVVAKVSYAVTDPTVTSQIISLQGAGADTLYLMRAEPRRGAGDLRRARSGGLERADLHALCRDRQERRSARSATRSSRA